MIPYRVPRMSWIEIMSLRPAVVERSGGAPPHGLDPFGQQIVGHVIRLLPDPPCDKMSVILWPEAYPPNVSVAAPVRVIEDIDPFDQSILTVPDVLLRVKEVSVYVDRHTRLEAVRTPEMCSEPFTSNAYMGLVVPIPTLPLTISPLLGPLLTPAYAPMATLPVTPKALTGLELPIPTLPDDCR